MKLKNILLVSCLGLATLAFTTNVMAATQFKHLTKEDISFAKKFLGATDAHFKFNKNLGNSIRVYPVF